MVDGESLGQASPGDRIRRLEIVVAELAVVRAGTEGWLDLDLEYILFPLTYRRPGNEVFVLLEATVRRKWADEADGRSLPVTGRTDVLLAPAVQHIISEQLLASLSVQLPVVSDAPPGGLEQDLDVLAGLRYAF